MTRKSKEAAEAAGLDTGRIEEVEFAHLAVSPLNVRKHNAEIGPDDELVHSIRAHGLLQPLIGYIARSGPATVLVCAGQRRLQALAHIAATDAKIPVRIVGEETAIEISLAENLERKDMNPVDELDAFKALIARSASAQQRHTRRATIASCS
jgi:ParB family chromosome partitioning protein